MKNKYFIYLIICLLIAVKVNAEACTLETKVSVNNDAGSVNASASSFEYSYTDTDSENGEEYEATAYTGLIHIYNLTPNIYAVASDGKKKITLNYDEENPNQVSFSTGGMSFLKEYTISIYPTNTNCGKSAIRELKVTVPRLNKYYAYDSCSDYPDYFYCSQFLSVNDITEEEFTKGIADYAKSHQSKSDENRKEGFLEETTNFLKKNWLIITIIIVIIISGLTTFIIIRNKKRKEQIV